MLRLEILHSKGVVCWKWGQYNSPGIEARAIASIWVRVVNWANSPAPSGPGPVFGPIDLKPGPPGPPGPKGRLRYWRSARPSNTGRPRKPPGRGPLGPVGGLAWQESLTARRLGIRH